MGIKQDCIDYNRWLALSKKDDKFFAKLIAKSPFVKAQFNDDMPFLKVDPHAYQFKFKKIDVLQENKFMPVKGLIYKYKTRALILLTNRCAKYCAFCFRRYLRGESNFYTELMDKDIKKILRYIKDHKEIHEVIFSGGDPFFEPCKLFYMAKSINDNLDSGFSHIYDIRIHTRMPVIAPFRSSCQVFDKILKLNKVKYLVLHINHPDELSKKMIKLVNHYRSLGVIVMSQTVLLHNINDNLKILKQLFYGLINNGIVPYYLHLTDAVSGIERYFVSFKKARSLYTKLQHSLPGIAIPKLVIDTPGGIGKVLVPTTDWQLKEYTFTDFAGEKKRVDEGDDKF